MGPESGEVSVLTIEPHGEAVFGLADVLASRELLYFLIWRDIKVRYKQTLIGVAWAILQPMLAMVVLTAFFGNPARLPSEGVPYPLFAHAGLMGMDVIRQCTVQQQQQPGRKRPAGYEDLLPARAPSDCRGGRESGRSRDFAN